MMSSVCLHAALLGTETRSWQKQKVSVLFIGDQNFRAFHREAEELLSQPSVGLDYCFIAVKALFKEGNAIRKRTKWEFGSFPIFRKPFAYQSLLFTFVCFRA